LLKVVVFFFLSVFRLGNIGFSKASL
jgi:hypothetical protein